MASQSRLPFWHAPLALLLILLLFGSGSSTAGLAAPASQEDRPNAVGDHLVTRIALSADSPNIIASGQDVNLSFSYSTTEAGGVQIFARPFSDGALSPGYSAHGSGVYPQSATGNGSGFFTINTGGTVVVDQIRIQILNANQSQILFETFIPVYYLFSGSPHLVSNLALGPDTPNVLAFTSNITAGFAYRTTQPGGARIFVRPFANGSLAPGYSANGSGVYATGSGSGDGFFTISSTPVVVDQIRVQMLSADQSLLLFEAFLPVHYRFRAAANSVSNINLNPDTPNVFAYNQDVNLTFTYNTSQAGGVRIFARPFSGASLTPGYTAHGSPIYQAGSGRATGSFRLTTGPATVDKIRIQMLNADQSLLLFETFIPVSLLWAGAGPPPGPDMQVQAIEVTQAVQDLNNSVDLVAGKATYVRVHVGSPVNSADVFATLRGRRGSITLNPVLSPGNPGADITVRTSPNREQLNDSFYFLLPSGWTAAGDLTLTARLDPNNAKNDLNQSNNLRAVTVNFKTTPALRLRLMNVQYTKDGTTHLASTSDLSALESWLRRAYPISSLQVTRQTFVYPNSGLPNVNTLNGLLAFSKLLRIIFAGEDGRVVYYGIVDDGGGFMRGKAAGIPGTIASGPTGAGDFGWDFDGTYGDWYGGHEIAHTRGRSHAEFCGAGGGTSYPYPGGRISPTLTGDTAMFGFDITTRAIYGPTWKDMMTYCANQWVSDFTYEGIRNYTVSLGSAGISSLAATAGQVLLVSGSADLEQNTATLGQVALIPQSATLTLPEPGDWRIVLVGAGNADLATYPFAPDELSDGEETPGAPAIIAEVVPWSVGTVRVEIRRNGQVLATRSVSANAPSVSISAPANGTTLPNGPFQLSWTGSDPDGDSLTYSVLFSNDAGATWEPIGTALTGTSITLNGAELPGGTVRLRVVASDGLLSAQATTGNLTLPGHPPTGQIDLPTAAQRFFPTQQVLLQASGYDLEDGTLGDGAFGWASSIDGPLGTGASLTTELTTGAHVITLTMTDSAGQRAQLTRNVTVAEAGSDEMAALSLAPFSVGVVVGFSDGPVQETISVGSTGDAELSWSASESVPWLTLDTAAGQTTGTLVATIDPRVLPVGIHLGTVVFTASQPGVSPVRVPVTVQVNGTAVFLPSVRR